MAQMIDISKLPFAKFSDRSELPDCSAIYFALSSKGDILYIGKSIHLQTRWKQHHRIDDLLRLKCSVIAWFKCDEKKLDQLEDELIARFRPLLNNLHRSNLYPESTTLKLPLTLWRQLRAIAKDEKRSLNAQILYIIQEWLRERQA